jgi:hypothetical protein
MKRIFTINRGAIRRRAAHLAAISAGRSRIRDARGRFQKPPRHYVTLCSDDEMHVDGYFTAAELRVLADQIDQKSL